MFTIRNAQMDVLHQDARERQVATLARHLVDIYPDRAIPEGTTEEDLRELVRRGIENAAHYSIHTVADVTRYLEYMVYYHLDFDVDPSLPWVHEILSDSTHDGMEKMDLLDAAVSARTT